MTVQNSVADAQVDADAKSPRREQPLIRPRHLLAVYGDHLRCDQKFLGRSLVSIT